MKSVTTAFMGSYYEKTGSTVTKYYMAGGQRVAMRKSGVVYWLVGDHAAGQRTPGLGSTSVVANQNATVHSRQLYKPWGESRYTYATLPTKRQYTGQYSDADFGLYDYVARFYDPQLGRFSQADTVTPGGVQGLDRYAGMANNPVVFNDPSGHDVGCSGRDASQCVAYNQPVHDPGANTMSQNVTVPFVVNVDLVEQTEASNNDFSQVPYQNGTGYYYANPPQNISDPVGAFNDTFYRFAAAEAAKAADADASATFYIDIYEKSLDEPGGGSLPFRVLDLQAISIQNNSSNLISAYMLDINYSGGPDEFSLDFTVSPGESMRMPVGAYGLMNYGNSVTMSLWINTYQNDPAGGLRAPWITFSWDSQDYYLSLTANRPPEVVFADE